VLCQRVVEGFITRIFQRCLSAIIFLTHGNQNMISIEWEVSMNQETLKQAISLSRAGKKLEARELLEGILKADPQQEAAWLWFADTYQSAGRRLQVLDTALHVNPGSQMVAQARDALLVASGFQSQKPQEVQPAPAATPPQETPAQQDITNLYLAFDPEKRVWRLTNTPQAVERKEEKPPAPPLEPEKTDQEKLDELMSLELQKAKSEPPVAQLPSEQDELDQLLARQLEAELNWPPAEPIQSAQEELDRLIAQQLEAELNQSSAPEPIQSAQEELDKLIAQQLEQQSASAETPAAEAETEEDELDPDIIVAESFVELLQAELESGQKEAPPDWMDTEARRVEQLISLADSEAGSGDSEPPAEPAEALQWVPEIETAAPPEAAEPVEPTDLEQPAQPEPSAKDEQPGSEKSIEDTQENKITGSTN